MTEVCTAIVVLVIPKLMLSSSWRENEWSIFHFRNCKTRKL